MSKQLKTCAFLIASMLTLILSAVLAPANAKGADLYNNTNTASVDNSPTGTTGFTLNGTAQVSELVTYHWNHGKGATPGTIGLKASTGQIYGPFQAHGTPSGAVPNVNWVADVNVTLQAGDYIVLDSDIPTWSQNAQSGYRGFVIVRGTKPPATLPEKKHDIDCTAGCSVSIGGGVSGISTRTYTCSAHGPKAACAPGEQQTVRCTDGTNTTICKCTGTPAMGGCSTH